jgi:hypothetical protein
VLLTLLCLTRSAESETTSRTWQVPFPARNSGVASPKEASPSSAVLHRPLAECRTAKTNPKSNQCCRHFYRKAPWVCCVGHVAGSLPVASSLEVPSGTSLAWRDQLRTVCLIPPILAAVCEVCSMVPAHNLTRKSVHHRGV